MQQNKQILIEKCLEKTNHYDKDERYMATSDICNELENDINFDPYFEEKLCSNILKQLNDTSNDVQSIAIRCLGILARKVKEEQVQDICTKLCESILLNQNELRDIYSIGLKTIIQDIPEILGASISSNICENLINGIQNNINIATEISTECVDILTYVLRRFGDQIACETLEKITEIILQALFNSNDNDSIMRKRSISCLGVVVHSLSDKLLDIVIKNIIKNGSMYNNDSILAIGVISRSIPPKLSKYLPYIFPLLLESLDNYKDNSNIHNEMKENILLALESLIAHCPSRLSLKYLNQNVLQKIVYFSTYDPNYNYDNEENDDNDMSEDDNYYTEDEDEEFDGSWRVRKASLMVLSSIIYMIYNTEENIFIHRDQFFFEYFNFFIERFKERDENVKNKIFSNFSLLIKSACCRNDKYIDQKTEENALPYFPHIITRNIQDNTNICAQFLRTNFKNVIMAVQKQYLKSNCISEIIQILIEVLFFVQPISDEQEKLLLSMFLQDNNIDIKNDSQIDTLKYDIIHFFRVFVELGTDNRKSIFHIENQRKLIMIATHYIDEENWYKLICECLKLLQAIIISMNSDDIYQDSIYKSLYKKLTTNDVDPEIKENAITTFGLLISYMKSNDDHEEINRLFLVYLQNENTRMVSLKALCNVFHSYQVKKCKIHVCTTSLEEMIYTLTDLLKQQSRGVKKLTIELLCLIIKNIHDNIIINGIQIFTKSLLENIISTGASILDESDFQLSSSIVYLMTLCTSFSSIIENMLKPVFVPCLISKICSSSLLEEKSDNLHDNITKFFQFLIQNGNDSVKIADYCINCLLNNRKNNDKDNFSFETKTNSNIAKFVGNIIIQSNSFEYQKNKIIFFIDNIRNSTSPEAISMACIGEIGKYLDISSFELEIFLLPLLNTAEINENNANINNKSNVEEFAAVTFGNVCIGNISYYLPNLLKLISDTNNENIKNHNKTYLLLCSLKRILNHYNEQCTDFNILSEFNNDLFVILSDLSTNDQEGLRNIVSECLSILFLIETTYFLPKFIEIMNLNKDSQINSCWTFINGFKHFISHPNLNNKLNPIKNEENPKPHDDISATSLLIHESISAFLITIKSDHIYLKKIALLTLNFIIYYHPLLIKQSLMENGENNNILIYLYQMTELKLEKVVDLGPFKHKVDDGSIIRKISFNIIETIIEQIPLIYCNNKMLNDLFIRVSNGLVDKDETKILCLHIIHKLCFIYKNNINLDTTILLFIGPIEKIIFSNELNKNDEKLELIRNGLRAIDSIHLLFDNLDTEVNRDILTNCIHKIENNEKLRNIICIIKEERNKI